MSGGGLAYELTNNPSSTNDNLSVGGNVNVLSNTNFAFTPLNGLLGTGSYRLIDYVGAAIANPNSVFTYTGS